MKDLARIYVAAGDGGNGKVSFRHEKFAPKGGPDGGDGGRGGDVVLVSDGNIDNLIAFNYQKRFEAPHGGHGLKKKMHGKDSPSITIPVPVGTVVWEIPPSYATADLRERPTFDRVLAERRLVIDMDTHDKRYIVAYGGKGGRGNDHFKSATNQTPREAEQGDPGETKWLLLEHKVVADAGIIGLPNVGKSSLLKALTRAHPKIAGYPFTTLEPNLGVFMRPTSEIRSTKYETNQKSEIKNSKQNMLILVDVPGVVEDAYEGKGIGPWFLRHLERTELLIHVLAPAIEILNSTYDTNSKSEILTAPHIADQLLEDYTTVRTELEKYGLGLPDKKELVVVNKMELIDEKMRSGVAQQLEDTIGHPVLFVSAGMGEVSSLVTRLSV